MSKENKCDIQFDCRNEFVLKCKFYERNRGSCMHKELIGDQYDDDGVYNYTTYGCNNKNARLEAAKAFIKEQEQSE